jgi:hypothetical protein
MTMKSIWLISLVSLLALIPLNLSDVYSQITGTIRASDPDGNPIPNRGITNSSGIFFEIEPEFLGDDIPPLISECQVDSGNFRNCGGGISYRNVPIGKHTLTLVIHSSPQSNLEPAILTFDWTRVDASREAVNFSEVQSGAGQDVQFRTYENANLGFKLETPRDSSVDEFNRTVSFYDTDGTSLMTIFVKEANGRTIDQVMGEEVELNEDLFGDIFEPKNTNIAGQPARTILIPWQDGVLESNYVIIGDRLYEFSSDLTDNNPILGRMIASFEPI